MANKKTRLEKAEEKYCSELHEWLTNPKNEDLPNDIVETKLTEAFNEFFNALILNEDECALFISKGHIIDELKLLPLLFEHFKSEKICKAIQSNCEVAFSQKFSTESKELEQERKTMLAKIMRNFM